VYGDVVAASPLAMDMPSLADSPGEPAADVIPMDYLGATFEWNADAGYYMQSDATGAPEDGVRVIFYAIDPTTGQPATPLNALGYVDARDLSTVDANQVNIQIVRTGDTDVTLADYTMSLSFAYTQSSFDFDVSTAGFLSNGTDQLNFDLSQGMSMTDMLMTMSQSFALDIEGTDKAVSFDATITGDPQSESDTPGTMDATAEISGNGQTVDIEISWADNALDGTISNNGAAVVSIGGTLDNPTFTDPDGNELTQAQRAALQSLWDGLGEIFDFVDNMFSWVG
jgi:hypothetical protein